MTLEDFLRPPLFAVGPVVCNPIRKPPDLCHGERRQSRSRKVVSEKGADETLQLLEEHGANVGELTPELEGKLKAKIRNHILVLVIIIDLMLYVCCSVYCGWEAFDLHGYGLPR